MLPAEQRGPWLRNTRKCIRCVRSEGMFCRVSLYIQQKCPTPPLTAAHQRHFLFATSGAAYTRYVTSVQQYQVMAAVYSYYSSSGSGLYSSSVVHYPAYCTKSSLHDAYSTKHPFVRSLCLVPSARSHQMSRCTAPTRTPSTTTALSRSIALQRTGSPSTSRALFSSTRSSTDTVGQEGGGGAAPCGGGGAFRSATKDNRQRRQLPVGPLEVYAHACCLCCVDNAAGGGLALLQTDARSQTNVCGAPT